MAEEVEGGGSQELRMRDGESNRCEIYELVKSNSMVRGVSANAEKEIIFLKEERKGLRQNLNGLGGGCSGGGMGTGFRNRRTSIRSRRAYDSAADEEGVKKRRI